MTWEIHDDEHVKVIEGDASAWTYLDQAPSRTPAQKHMDEALMYAEDLARASLKTLTEALQWFAVVRPDYRSTLPTEVGQFIEAVAETKRLRG